MKLIFFQFNLLKTANIYLFISILPLLFSCRTQYAPPAVMSGVSNLVVEGTISGNDSTVIKLSRTVNVASLTRIKPETDALITVEGSDNSTYHLKELLRNDGAYSSGVTLPLNNTLKYRIRIITADHKTYLSDFTEVKESPPIDSIYYKLDDSGVHIYADTHDATNRSRYYRYEYVETWIFHTHYSPQFVVKNNTIVPRTTEPDVFTCWRNVSSTDVLLASSAKLTRDIIFQAPITQIPKPSQKIRIRYSILVKQYALTEDAFNFWQLVKKTTEQLGSIFDPQPSQINGNIHNINNMAESVFGFVSVGTVQQKRIFIDRVKLPAIGWGTDDPYAFCLSLDTTQKKIVTPPDFSMFYNNTFMPISSVGNAYLGVFPPCVDCTLAGTITRPAFW